MEVELAVQTTPEAGRAAEAMESPKRKKLAIRTSGTTPPKVPPQKTQLRGAGDIKDNGAVGEASSSQKDAGEVAEEIPLPVRGAPKKKAVEAPPRHRLGEKTPHGLAGRVARLVSARTTETAVELPGEALAECILQVTGPPTVTRSATRARHLLHWLRLHTKRGSARVCGRKVSPEDVQVAAKLVGNVWSKKLMKLQKRMSNKDKKKRLLRTLTDLSLRPADAPAKKEKEERDPDKDGSSDSDFDEGNSDLSSEEDVDSEAEAGAEDGREALVEAAEAMPDDGYKGDWSSAPKLGSSDFNGFAAAAMSKAGVACGLPGKAPSKKGECPPLQPHQDAAIFLLHPKSPVSRLLVDHPTGSGKTREMIEVLDNFFHDPRPKVPVFPKEPVCRNFYAELLRWPSKYRDYFCCLRPHCAARASRGQDWRSRRTHLWDISYLGEKELRAICREMREVLEMKGCFYMGRMRSFWRDDFRNRFPDEPLPMAPLRALRYTSAGGRHTALREEDGLPVSALFKIGFSPEDPNVYSNKIVIMDEVHNLVRTQTQFGDQLTHLRSLLFGAKGAVLAGFTGTPILSEPQEGRQLLDIIKGSSAPLGDAGFISSFPMRPPSLFPASLPRGIPDNVLTPKLRRQFVQKVPMTGEALQRYDKKRALGLPLRRLQRYCNLCVHFGAMHEGKSGSKARVLDDFEGCAPKLHAIAQDVARESSKALVLVARHSGMDTLIAHLKRMASPAGGPSRFGVATMDELAAFNSAANLRGELYRVLVADATSCGEGVSFFAVRRVMLADVPQSPSSLVQAVGRSIRMYGHSGLPEDEWTVTTTLYSATLPRWLKSPMGSWAYRAQRHHQEAHVAQSKARRLLRTLMKVGIPTLDVLRERVVKHFPREAAECAAAAAAAAAAAEAAALAPALAQADVAFPSQETLPSFRLEEQADASMDPGESAGSQHASPKQELLDSVDMDDLPLSQGTTDTTAGSTGEPSDATSSSGLRRSPSSPPPQLKRNLSSTSGVGSSPRSSKGEQELPDNTPRSSKIPGSNPTSASASAKPKEQAPAGPKLPHNEVVRFLESIGLWKEAKNMNTSKASAQQMSMKRAIAAKLQGSSSKRSLTRRSSKEVTPSAKVGRKPGAPVGRKPGVPVQTQHYMARALQWLLEGESVAQLSQKYHLGSRTADEDAMGNLAEASRALVPALRELRREAIDREVLEGLMASLGAVDEQKLGEESEGESSACDFGVSDGEDDTEDDGPPPLVLPSDWQMQRVKRGKVTVREYVDPNGNRYRTEAQARKAVDDVRRSANMSSRLKQQFEARLAAAASASAAATGAGGAAAAAAATV